jgi:hypothetical protein
VQALIDAPAEQGYGFSFLKLRANWLTVTRGLIMRQAEAPPKGVALLCCHGQWDPPAIQQYLQSTQAFL